MPVPDGETKRCLKRKMDLCAQVLNSYATAASPLQTYRVVLGKDLRRGRWSFVTKDDIVCARLLCDFEVSFFCAFSIWM
jgi:hypothetical protein